MPRPSDRYEYGVWTKSVSPFEKYRTLLDALAYVREEFGEASFEEGEILRRLDEVWAELSPEEIERMNKHVLGANK